jgi:ABC-type phosphate transport system auxiliary subunit
MNKTLDKVKELRRQVKELHFEDIDLINHRIEADLALLKIEKKLEESESVEDEI